MPLWVSYLGLYDSDLRRGRQKYKWHNYPGIHPPRRVELRPSFLSSAEWDLNCQTCQEPCQAYFYFFLTSKNTSNFPLKPLQTRSSWSARGGNVAWHAKCFILLTIAPLFVHSRTHFTSLSVGLFTTTRSSSVGDAGLENFDLLEEGELVACLGCTSAAEIWYLLRKQKEKRFNSNTKWRVSLQARSSETQTHSNLQFSTRSRRESESYGEYQTVVLSV